MVQVSTSTHICQQYGNFNQQPSELNMKKNNCPENSIIYINKEYLTVENNKKMNYDDHFTLGQIMEAINPPENTENYVCKDREVKYYRPRYDVSTGQLLGLYETIGYFVVRRDDDEHFLNYCFL